MSNQFSPEDDDRMPEKKSSQQLLLLILLLLIVIFAYLYFFTGVIRSRGNESPPPAPVAEVKGVDLGLRGREPQEQTR